ncbi:hypothetical protein SNE40_021870 [Patella caerulea]|uniref:Uncharacterized protein n=1 Tax=Patella caerulea TaxID=87958 RepID=A0AAN8G8S3_PATCE
MLTVLKYFVISLVTIATAGLLIYSDWIVERLSEFRGQLFEPTPVRNSPVLVVRLRLILNGASLSTGFCFGVFEMICVFSLFLLNLFIIPSCLLMAKFISVSPPISNAETSDPTAVPDNSILELHF